MRDNKLSNSVFNTYDTIVDRCCAAWTLAHRNAGPHPLPRSRALDQNGHSVGRVV